MRRAFARELLNHMRSNKDIVLVTFDLGYGMFDRVRDELPNQFYNVGASEQAGMDIAVGMALSNKIVFTYTITPFYYRCFETLRTYINHEMLNVKLIGSGRDDDYKHDGFSHDASDIYYFMDGFSNIAKFYPDEKEEIPTILTQVLDVTNPCFISLKR